MNTTEMQSKSATTSKTGKTVGKIFMGGLSKKSTVKNESETVVPVPEDKPVQKEDTNNFVYVDEFKKALELAYLTEENIIFFGRGGHGKSEFTEFFFEQKEIEPFVKTMGSGTTTDSLFGGIDIKKFNETGSLEYLVENSFMNHEYVIFEELFDAPDYILEQLKDILTSKKFRNGSQVFNIKTKLIVCCTNKTREEFSKNDSLKALMERFPLEFKVEWSSYTRTTYEYMFSKMLGKPFEVLAYLMEKLHIQGTTVSPRTAMKAAKILEKSKGDISCLDFIADFSGKNKALIDLELKKFKSVEEIDILIKKVNNHIKDFNALSLTTLVDVKTCKAIVKNIDNDIKTLQAKKVDDDLLKHINASIEEFKKFIETKTKEIIDATEA